MDEVPLPLIIGAGPVGLTMACELARHGVPCRIVDRNHEPSQTSKALGIFPRTLEVFQTMGLADNFLAAGHRLHGLVIHHRQEVLAAVDLTVVTSPFPFALSLPQSETERLLIDHLRSLGIEVERGVTLTALAQTSDAVHATLARTDGSSELVTTPWLIGCDGAHSATRHALGLDFEGASYDESFILADVRVATDLARERLHLYLGDEGIIGLFPFGGDRWRIVANIPPESRAQALPDVTLEEVQRLTSERGTAGILLSDPVWMSRFHISHRKVRDYRHLRVFLAGDAAHIHSPAGGQGMNTGIQDAFNLGWKLALVVRERAPTHLLGSYQLEREPVARGVLNLTDRITRMATMRNSIAQSVRDFLLPMVSGIDFVSGKIAEQLCELTINYRDSPVSETKGSGKPRAGDRAPDAELRDAGGRPRRIHELTQTPRLVLLFFLGGNPEGAAKADAVASVLPLSQPDLVAAYRIARGIGGDACDLRDITGLTHAAYGLRNGGVVLIRPDGYIAYRSDGFEAEGLRRYFTRTFTR